MGWKEDADKWRQAAERHLVNGNTAAAARCMEKAARCEAKARRTG